MFTDIMFKLHRIIINELVHMNSKTDDSKIDENQKNSSKKIKRQAILTARDSNFIQNHNKMLLKLQLARLRFGRKSFLRRITRKK